jgi:hypothetical protein
MRMLRVLLPPPFGFPLSSVVIGNKIKTIVLISFLFLFIVADGYCAEKVRQADAAMSEINCNFSVPAEWEKVSNNIYTLRNFSKTFKKWYKFLSAGHQPWRLEPINTAGACLWDFGIKDNSRDIFEFADRITEITENKLYVLQMGNRSYYVFVRVSDSIPVAYKLVVIGN